MADKFHKLDEDEVRKLYNQLKSHFNPSISPFKMSEVVRKYFPKASSILVTVNSEYNDNGYDNVVGSVFVYDSKDVELGLDMEARRKFLNEFPSVNIPGSEEPMEDIVMLVTQKIPEIYIKE